jgi:hypothetical protein
MAYKLAARNCAGFDLTSLGSDSPAEARATRNTVSAAFMHFQRVSSHQGGRLARNLVCRAMSANSAPAPKRRKESADASGRQTALQWGDSFSLPGLVVQNLSMRVPLSHEQPEGEQITVFARLVSSSSRSREPTGPFLVYLQGSHHAPPLPTPLPWSQAAQCSSHLILIIVRMTQDDP